MNPSSLHHLLKQRLDAGEWSPGQRMPSIRKLTAAVDFSYHDVVSAYAQLVSVASWRVHTRYSLS